MVFSSEEPVSLALGTINFEIRTVYHKSIDCKQRYLYSILMKQTISVCLNTFVSTMLVLVLVVVCLLFRFAPMGPC